MLINILMIILGFVLLVIGADLLVRSASNIATKFHIPEMLIGLTIVALGTSAPELIITITSATSGANDLIIGNAVGSNLCNLLLILGLMAIICLIFIEKVAKKIHIPMALFATLVILFLELSHLGSNSFSLGRVDGIILIILFLIYFSYPIFAEIKNIKKAYIENKTNPNSNTQNINIFVQILFIILGVVLLKYGGDFVVDYATNIAEYFSIPERIIGLTIVAIGTAMPELITSIIAVIRKDTDLAVGNLVGSCVLNLFLILGVGAIITPLEFSTEFTQNLILLSFSTLVVLLFNFIGKKNTITRWKGLILLGIFSVYMAGLFVGY